MPAVRYLAQATLQFHTLPITGFARNNGEEVNLIDRPQIRRLVQAAFADSFAPPSGAPPVAQPTQRQPSNGTDALTDPSTRTNLSASGDIPCVD